MHKKILITAGGTGGHVYPAQGLAQKLKKVSNNLDVLFVAGGLCSNRYFDRTSFSYKEVACSGLIHKNPIKLFRGFINLFKGVFQSIRFMKEYRPDVVVGFGSYYTVSTLLAAKLLKIPIVLHEANSIPGKANKWFAPYVKCVGIHFPATSTLLKGKTFEVGLPLREGYLRSATSRLDARAYFQLDDKTPTLLIFGGSQGAHAINNLIKESLKNGFKTPLQVIHLTGDKTIIDELSTLYASRNIKACVKQFEGSMNLAWEAADLFIGRSGASTIAEAMEFEVPGILIPYPYAAENHQEKNADFFVEDVKGGVKLIEKGLTPEKLYGILEHEIKESSLKTRRQGIKTYKERPNKKDLCQLVLEVVNSK